MTHRVRSAVTAVLVLSAAACAPGTAPAPSTGVPVPATWAADEAAIRATTRESADAWNRGDLRGHLAFYVDSVTFMTRNGPRPGVDAVERAFTEAYFVDGMPKQRLDFEQVTVRPLGRDAALETGRFVLSGGGLPEQSGWFTLVWIRTADGWRAVHDHSS